MKDSANPSYDHSSLYFFERNEAVFGRSSPQCSLQETPRALNQFQASLVDLDDLRTATENLHCLFLRGFVPKLTGRGVAEQAKAMLHYSKLPRAIIERMPKYRDLLHSWQSLPTFHTMCPIGRTWPGVEVTEKPDFPILSQDSVDKVVDLIFMRLYYFKRHPSLI